MTDNQVDNVTNYLVPAAGQTHAVTISGTFSATPRIIDWRQFAIDNFPFVPQGVFIDNSAGTGDLSIDILPINYTIKCVAGATMQAQFPAPNGQTASITGDGSATCFFVDFPVLPSNSQVSINGEPTVKIAAQPIDTTPSVDNAGTPYHVAQQPEIFSTLYLSVSGAALNASGDIDAYAYLRGARITLSGNASLAAAGENLFTLSVGGIAIWKQTLELPAVAGTAAQLFSADITWPTAAPGGVGAAQQAVEIVSANALATGILECNLYAGVPQ